MYIKGLNGEMENGTDLKRHLLLFNELIPCVQTVFLFRKKTHRKHGKII